MTTREKPYHSYSAIFPEGYKIPTHKTLPNR